MENEDRYQHAIKLGAEQATAHMSFSVQFPDESEDGEIKVTQNDDLIVVLSAELEQWCKENIGPYELLSGLKHPQFKDGFFIVFADAKDAISFKLRWS